MKKVKEFVKPGGYVAVSAAVWLKPGPPPEVVALWKEYPEIDTVEAKLEVIERLGYETTGHFIFPPSAWTDQYCDPMEKRVLEKGKSWRGIPEAEAVLAAAQDEISVFRKHHEYYSDAFFVMRR